MAAAASGVPRGGGGEVHAPVHGTSRCDADCARLAAAPLRASDLSLLYAVHLFGGACMATDPAAGPVDERGAAFAARGLFVADASALPGNTGVNPQITVMANALRVAGGILAAGRVA
jgi:choline dehydrogenase-like flavoprotein